MHNIAPGEKEVTYNFTHDNDGLELGELPAAAAMIAGTAARGGQSAAADPPGAVLSTTMHFTIRGAAPLLLFCVLTFAPFLLFPIASAPPRPEVPPADKMFAFHVRARDGSAFCGPKYLADECGGAGRLIPRAYSDDMATPAENTDFPWRDLECECLDGAGQDCTQLDGRVLSAEAVLLGWMGMAEIQIYGFPAAGALVVFLLLMFHLFTDLKQGRIETLPLDFTVLLTLHILRWICVICVVLIADGPPGTGQQFAWN